VIDPTSSIFIRLRRSKLLFRDAAERSISGTPAAAAGFYNKGITASFNYWGLSNAEATLTYLSRT
jgi:hypothetical protein